MTNGASTYPLLTSTDAALVRIHLETKHQYYYHFTLDVHLGSIATSGLSPCFEGDDSRYSNRDREPLNAMRFCVQSALPLGLSAANARNGCWDERAYIWLPKTSKVVLIRTPAASLLSRSFGLDHSFSNADHEVSRILGNSRQHLSTDEFIGVVMQFGSISCYDVIPAAELEICCNPHGFCQSLIGEFLPL